MRVDRDQYFAGIPAIEIRDMCRRIGPGGLVAVEFVQDRLRLNPGQADVVLKLLIAEGFMATDLIADQTHYRLTLKGSALALATAAKPLRRKSAEAILKRLLDRVEVVRLDPAYLFRVRKIVLFGSMTTDAERVNDVDVGIAYARKEPDVDRHMELGRQSAKAAAAAGRHFGTYADWLDWPIQKVLLFLKSRSSGLSLHPLDDWVLSQPGVTTIYEHDDALGQQRLFDR